MNDPGRGIRARLGALKERLFDPYAAGEVADERICAWPVERGGMA